MSRYSDQVTDEYGRTIPGVSVYVYVWDADAQVAGDLETLTDDLSAPLVNPLTSDADGVFYFNAVDGQKLLEYHYGGKVQERSLILVGKLPVPQAVFGGLFTNANALTVPVGMDMVGTTGYASLGVGAANYIYDATVDAAYVTANPRSSFISANSRGFRLDHEQDITPEMLGAVANGTTGDNAAVVAAIANLTARALTGHGYGSGTPPLNIPASAALYAMGATPLDITFTMRIAGENVGVAGGWASAQKWSANSHGYRVQYYDTSGDTATGSGVAGGSGSIIDGLAVQGAFNGTTALDGDYHGFFLRTQASLRDIQAWDWQGDGVRIHAGVALTESGNGNCWEVRRAWFQNTRNGIYADGSDVNQGIGYAINVSGARQWGIYDNAGIQNLYIAPLTQLCGYSNNDGTAGKSVAVVANVAGTHRFAVISGRETQASTNAPPATAVDDVNWYYYQDGGTDAFHPTWFSGINLRAGGPYHLTGGTLLHPYAESVQPPSQLGGAVLRIGGTLGNRTVGGAHIYASSNQVVVNDLRVTTGNINLDDDGNGVLKIPRFSVGNPYAYLECSSASGGLLITSPDGTTAVEITDTGIQFDDHVSLIGGKVLKVAGLQVVSARDTGWTADTGTAKRTANTTYTAGATLTYSAAYVQAEQTAMATRVAALELVIQANSQTIKALKDLILAHGLGGA